MEYKKEDVFFFPRVWLYARTGSGHRAVAEQQLAELREWATCNGYCVVGQAANVPGPIPFGAPVCFPCSGPCAGEMLIPWR